MGRRACYLLKARVDLDGVRPPRAAGEVFRANNLGFACALVRRQLAEPADDRTRRDVEIGLLLQDMRPRPQRPPKISF